MTYRVIQWSTGNVGKQAEGVAEKTIGTAQRKAGEIADKARKA